MGVFPETIRTPRLRYERADEAVDAFERYEWTRASRPARERETEYVRRPEDPHPRAAGEWLADRGRKFEDGERANWALFARPGERDADGEPVEAGERVYVGTADLAVLWEPRRAYTGVVLHEPFWGRGYSGERADALLKAAFERLDLDVAAAAHVVGNENSRRAIEKWTARYGGAVGGEVRNWLPHDGAGSPWDVREVVVAAADYRAAGGAPDAELEPDEPGGVGA